MDGNIQYANRRYVALLGYPEEDLVGLPYHYIWHPDMPRGALKAMWKIITSARIWRGYLKHLCNDGSYFWTLAYIHAKFDDEGRMIGYGATGKLAHEVSKKAVEKRYKELFDDKYIDNE